MVNKYQNDVKIDKTDILVTFSNSHLLSKNMLFIENVKNLSQSTFDCSKLGKMTKI